MKKIDWQLLRHFLLWLVFSFMVALSLYSIFREKKNYSKTLAEIFSPLFHLLCYSQVASIFLLNPEYLN